VCVTNWSSDANAKAFEMLINPDDCVLVENPTYRHASPRLLTSTYTREGDRNLLACVVVGELYAQWVVGRSAALGV
jgi:hypothetical protein